MFSDWGIQSKNLTFSTGSASRKTQSKKFYICFLNSSYRSSHHKTHTLTPTHPYQVPHTHTRYHTPIPGTTHPYQVPHTHTRYHTPIPGTTQQYHTTAPTLASLPSLLLLLAASQRGALLAPLANSVYHTTAAARNIDAILPTTATPAEALAALG